MKSGDLLFANPSGQHASGKASRKAIYEARSQIYSTFHQSEKDSYLLFHSGATEAYSTFAFSFSEWAKSKNCDLLVCYTKLDHPAVLSLAARNFGGHVTFFELIVDQNLDYDHSLNLGKIQQLKELNPNMMILYHHLWVHNETGVVAPLEELAPFKAIKDLYVHVDAVQTPGKIEDWDKLTCGDVFTFSGHKFGALKGIGFSFISKKISVYPLITGGGQQGNLRSGTENVLGIQSIALALKDLNHVDVAKNTEQRVKLEAFIKRELGADGGIISERSIHRNSNTIYFYLETLSSDIALALFDQMNLMISAGSACSSGAAKPGQILTHLNYKEHSKNGLRLSFGFHMTDTERTHIEERFKLILQKIRAT